MLSKEDQGHIKRVKKVAYKLNLPEELIEQALHYTSEYIKNKIGNIELPESHDLTEEEFNTLFPSIKVFTLGYLKPSYRKYKHINKHKNKNK